MLDKEKQCTPLVSDGEEETKWKKHKHLIIGNLLGVGNVFFFILGVATLQVIKVRPFFLVFYMFLVLFHMCV